MIIEALSGKEKQELIDEFYWYQTIDLGDGVKTNGTVDHSDAFDRYGFPSVAGRSVLDVGASDGFFSMAFERLGAARVLAVDVDRWRERPAYDFPPRTRARRMRKYLPSAGEDAVFQKRRDLAQQLGFPSPDPFFLTKALLSSNVEHRELSIYDLSSLQEQFDLVFVGTVTSHLQDLHAAFEAVREVTKELAVIACPDVMDYETLSGWRWTAFHAIRALRALGRLNDHVAIAREDPTALFTANDGGSIWRPSVTCVREMLLSAGFKDVEVRSRFALKNLRRGTAMDHVVFHAFV